jgi:hypothetical protein
MVNEWLNGFMPVGVATAPGARLHEVARDEEIRAHFFRPLLWPANAAAAPPNRQTTQRRNCCG